MNDDLYFIPILVRAMDSPDKERALADAFRTIEEMGRKSAFAHGYVQFTQFIETVAAHVLASSDDIFAEERDTELTQLIAFATDTLEGSAEQRSALREAIAHSPTLRELHERICAHIEEPGVSVPPIEVIVQHQDGVSRSMILETIPGTASLSNVVAGRYTVSLSTGRVLWEDELRKEDLVWSHAWPGRPLQLAADTGEASDEPTREETLLNGELVLRTFAGRESGRMEVEARCPENSCND